MPAFHALDHYSPLVVLALGLATFAGSWGTGFVLLRAMKLRIPSPWLEVAAALLGASVSSLCVEVVAMCGLATTSTLVLLWLSLLGVGAVGLAGRIREIEWGFPDLRGLGLLVPAALLLAAVVNLLLAMAPTTKIDEINYQILPPSRIVADGQLVFYLRPWPAYILPQMGYSIAAAPLHAVGRIDAANVWSWCLGVMLAWFGARLVYEGTRSRFAALTVAAATMIGLYPSVYHTTGGPHALGDLATAGAVLGIAFREDLLRRCTPVAFLVLLSVCCLVAASTKVSLVPLAGAILVLGLVSAIHSSPREWPRLLVAAAVPWVVLYLPLLLWTYWQSGSPFGAMLGEVFAPSTFGAIHADMLKSREVNQGGAVAFLRDYVLHYPAIFPLAALGAIASPAAPRYRRLLLASLLVGQVLTIALLLPHQARFLSGLHHALLVVGVIEVYPYVQRWMARPVLRSAAVVVLLVPWLVIQVYRAWFLVPIALGVGDEDEYYRSFIALYDDFRELDRILPEDSVLFVRDRLPLVYFPRAVYMDYRDLPEDRRAFALLAAPEGELDAPDCTYLRLRPGCRLGEPIYTNPKARTTVYRAPGHEPETQRIEVREILTGEPERVDR